MMMENKRGARIEVVANGRWLVRDASGARRGEVFGGSSTYQAQTMRGKFVGNATSLRRAADLLVS